MSPIKAFLAENGPYLSKSSAAAIESIPDSAWPSLLAAVEVLGGADPGIDCKVVVTHETLADFDGARATHWSERGLRTELMLGGFPAVNFHRFQLRQGEMRQDQVVIDLGDFRISLS